MFSRIIHFLKRRRFGLHRIGRLQIDPTIQFEHSGLCKILRTRAEVTEAIEFIHAAGYAPHPCEAKNWDLAHIFAELDPNGNFLDMGSWESHVLANLAQRSDFTGQLYGIDLQAPHTTTPGVTVIVGDLMATGLPSEHFASISCVSVIEHGVDFQRFAAEASRLLRGNGTLFVTFDYWEPRLSAPKGLYGLPWQPLGRNDVEKLIAMGEQNGLDPVAPMSWELDESVIRPGYYSPEPSMSYTFGLVTFRKRAPHGKWTAAT